MAESASACVNPPCEEVGPFRYCPVKGCSWMEATDTQKWGLFRAGESVLQVFEDGDWHDVDLTNPTVRRLIAERLNHD